MKANYFINSLYNMFVFNLSITLTHSYYASSNEQFNKACFMSEYIVFIKYITNKSNIFSARIYAI